MSAALRVPGMILWLVVVWILLWGSLSWANVLGGVVVAAGVVLVGRLDPASLKPSTFRPHWALWFLVVLVAKLVQSNVRLAWEILSPGDGTHTAIVAVPMRGGSDAVVTLVANAITMTPGTMTLDVRRHDRSELVLDDFDVGIVGGDVVPAGVTLYVHGMFASDVESVRHDVLQLEALALRAFGSADDYRNAAADVIAHEDLIGTGPIARPDDGDRDGGAEASP